MKYLSGIILAIFTAFLFSCNVEKQANKKVAWLLAHDLMDDNCARLFPVRDSLVVRDSTSFDTLYVENEVFIRDTIIKEGKVIYIEKKCPPHQVITKIVTRDSIIYKRQTSEEDRLKGEILKKEKLIAEKDAMIIAKDKKIDKNNWWKIACIITWALIVIYVVIKIKK
jgi:hypothetical protein